MNFKGILLYLRKNYAIAASGFVVVLCMAVYFVRDEQIKRLEADYDDLSIRRSRILKNLRHAAELPRDLEQIKVYSKEVQSRLFNPEDLGGNKVYFYQRESATGVKLPSLEQYNREAAAGAKERRGRKRGGTNFQEIGFEMTASGTYEQALAFLRELEGGPAFYKLETLSVVPADKAGAVNMRLGISILGKKR